MGIRFGTDGWRGVISEDFNFENVRRVAQAVASYLNEEAGAGEGIAVGYDDRFLSPEYARCIAAVLAANSIRVQLSAHSLPTPALSWWVHRTGLALGLMVTASHNPCHYNGIKIKGSFGGSVGPDVTRRIEAHLGRAGRQDPGSPLIDRFDPDDGYLSHLGSLVNLEDIAAAGLAAVCDAMHGSVRGYLPRLLARGGVAVEELRGEHNPGFGGHPPEPIQPYLTALRQRVPARRAALGLATDGDGDRLGVIDERGRFVSPQRVFALLLRHLVENRRQHGPVAKTFSTTHMVDRLAARYGLPLHVAPIGFKHICRLMVEREVVIGGEESGGVGFSMHIPERDAPLMALLLLEAVATWGVPLSEVVADTVHLAGGGHFRRHDLPLAPEGARSLLERLRTEAPASLAGRKVREIADLDGHKFLFDDGAWLLLRPSGTEPVLRIYAEAESELGVEALAEAGRALVRRLSG